MAADAFIGEMMPFTGNFAVRQFAECGGQLISISQFSAAYAILGTFYGGDGRSTFSMPDLRGRSPVSHGQAPGLSYYPLGSKGGNETVQLTTAQLPEHSHSAVASVQVSSAATATLSVASNNANSPVPTAAAYLGKPQDSSYFLPSPFEAEQLVEIQGPDVQVESVVDNATVTVGNTGLGQEVSLLSPFTTINWQMCLNGLFPSRA
ncbi:tail fiber protein [Pseudoalteromonas sp. DL2-H2.2]|uniref:phage tail protein n=1 Tax=Pseudoalteromonas sp. DL2-H2.2 TaxID=2908889 RepID=UPI001F192335|nr:tail fiber protein [Pseudoalteromonas sp. DL2-H2.2]MCF2907382.1 tail fiber protein [Pseudoalteromonas sp. DL2-H2.2]